MKYGQGKIEFKSLTHSQMYNLITLWTGVTNVLEILESKEWDYVSYYHMPLKVTLKVRNK